MNQFDPEHFVTAGQALIGLGRTIQRTYPPPSVVGCQFEEQKVIDELLPGNVGTYVDIGANDGIDCSNTYQLYKRGWRGLLIEPLPDVWPSLMLNRAGDLICPLAASDVDGYATLSCCRSVSSLDRCWRKDNESTMPVRTERLETILKRYQHIDWTKTSLLSVDCEGSEGAVFRGINWATFKPTVIIVEHCDQHGNDSSAEWMPILEAQNYVEHFRNKLNAVFTLKS